MTAGFGCPLALWVVRSPAASLQTWSFRFMADVIQGTQQEFWRAPAVPTPAAEAILSPVPPPAVETCTACGREFMIGASFCHTCGLRRPIIAPLDSHSAAIEGSWHRAVALVRSCANTFAAFWERLSFPSWLRYLHFHEIQQRIGLSTASLIAFIIGLGCVAGMIGVSLFYKASNLAEFQAIQMWRIEWLLGAAAAFLAGILLKKPHGE
jgi:hypothetical protein